jgi:uncharacterized membrane protein
MASATIIASIVLFIISVVLIVIAASVAVGLAGQLPSPTNQQLLTAGIMTYFLGILIIVTIVLGLSWISAHTKGMANAKGKGIAFLVLLIISILVYIVIIVLTIVTRASNTFDSTQQGALTANLVLIGVSVITFAISIILLRATFKPKGL